MAFTSYAQNFEDVMLWRALGKIREGFYIDVGAESPDVGSVTRAFYERGWTGVNIEPNETYYNQLAERRTRDINLKLAAGERLATLELHVLDGTGLSTFRPEIAERHALQGLIARKEQVQVWPLAEICRLYAKPDIHFLKVDVEGFEVEVVAGADFEKYRPWIIVVEATEPTRQTLSYSQWEPTLLNAGYIFAWFDGLNRFYISEERAGSLIGSFQTPPNVFDDFVLPGQARVALATSSVDMLEASTPSSLDDENRIAMALRCHDADSMLKVSGAGTVVAEPDGTAIQIMHNGLRMVAGGYYGEWMTRLIELCRGHHEAQEELIFQEVLRCTSAQATMVELGGYWAYYSLWFLQGMPLRKAIIIEPDPAHIAVGRRNAALNNLYPVFRDGFAGATSKDVDPFQTEKSGLLPLACLTVAEIMRDHAIDHLDILHLDIQGAELEVLESCRGLFRNGRVSWVFVSTHAFQISGDALTHQRCLVILRDCGAEIEADVEVHESFSGDGLIVGRFKAAPEGWRGPIKISHNRYSESLFRNPLYDLSERLRNTSNSSQFSRDVVAVYRSLLLRDPDPEGLRNFSDFLKETGNLEYVLREILRSEEFAANRQRFLSSYDAYRSPVEIVDASDAGGAVSCSGVRLTLREDGMLGCSGDSLLIPVDQIMLPAVRATGSWQPEGVDFAIGKLDREGRYTLLDIGANVGLFSRQFLNAFPQTQRCICAEPDPGNFEALSFNLRQYGNKIELYNHAVGLEDGEAEFYCDEGNCGNYSLNTDAMRDRLFYTKRVSVAAASRWFPRVLSSMSNLIWKSDTQGHDEIIITQTPEDIWNRIEFAMVELWRIRKPPFDRDVLASRLNSFPFKCIGRTRSVTTAEILEYIASEDWTHDDLYLWR